MVIKVEIRTDSINYRKLSYKIGTCIELHCIADYWPDLVGDYEVIGYTNITEFDMLGLSFYDMHFKNGNVDDFYNDLLRNKVPIYIMKPITRVPYNGKDDGILDIVNEYLYLADNMIDKNTTLVLCKRIELSTNIVIGRYDLEDIDQEFELKIKNDFINILDDYSDRYRVAEYERLVVLQPEIEAEEEDRYFEEKQAKLIAEQQAKIKAERERLERLVEREMNLSKQDIVLQRRKRELAQLQRELEEREEELKQQEYEMDKRLEALEIRQLEIAEKEAELNARATKIKNRENQLGLVNSNL